MKAKVLHTGTVSSGRLIFKNPSFFSSEVYRLNGQEFELTIAKRRKARSTDQNAYYWAVVVEMIANEIGDEDPEYTHEMLRWKFLKIHRDGLPDSCRSTTGLSTVEFEEYLSKIRAWASDFLELFIPLPNEILEEA